MRRAAALLVPVLLAVSACSGGSVSSTTASEDRVGWRGAVITGQTPKTGEPIVEAAWQDALASFGASPEPRGWTIVLDSGRVPCPPPPFVGNCGSGLTSFLDRTIEVTWMDGPGELRRVLVHEFCHFIRFRRTGSPGGPECTT